MSPASDEAAQAQAQIQSIAVSLARMEGKIDAYSSRTTAVEEKVGEIDVRLRTAATEDDVRSLDERLRAMETRSVVTPGGLVAALGATLTILLGLVTFLDRLIGVS